MMTASSEATHVAGRGGSSGEPAQASTHGQCTSVPGEAARSVTWWVPVRTSASRVHELQATGALVVVSPWLAVETGEWR